MRRRFHRSRSGLIVSGLPALILMVLFGVILLTTNDPKVQERVAPALIISVVWTIGSYALAAHKRTKQPDPAIKTRSNSDEYDFEGGKGKAWRVVSVRVTSPEKEPHFRNEPKLLFSPDSTSRVGGVNESTPMSDSTQGDPLHERPRQVRTTPVLIGGLIIGAVCGGFLVAVVLSFRPAAIPERASRQE